MWSSCWICWTEMKWIPTCQFTLQNVFVYLYSPSILNIKLTLDVKLDGTVHTCITLQLTDKDNSVVLLVTGCTQRLLRDQRFSSARFTRAPLRNHCNSFWLDGSIPLSVIQVRVISFLNLCPKQVPSGQWTWLNGDCCLERINYWAISFRHNKLKLLQYMLIPCICPI